jgi:hypothetical protein
VRHGDSAGCNEVAGCAKARQTNVSHKVVSEVGPIGQIENLKDRLKVGALTNSEVLRHARIQLKERLPPYVVEGCVRTLARAHLKHPDLRMQSE